MTHVGPVCGAFIGLAVGLGLGADVGAQMPDKGVRLARASDDFQRGDHASAWFGFWGLAREGDPAGQFNLAQLYRQGIGIAADFSLARYWYAEAAAQGHAHAQYNLGVMYERGDGTEPDLVEAKAWYRRAAAQDAPGARAALDRLETPKRSSEIAPRSIVPGLAEAARR